MKITRISMISGVERTFDLDVTDEQYERFANQGVHIQDAFPHLSAGDREFILTGITNQEWDAMMSDPDDMDPSLGINDDEPVL